jgi:hypothetical protein
MITPFQKYKGTIRAIVIAVGSAAIGFIFSISGISVSQSRLREDIDELRKLAVPEIVKVCTELKIEDMRLQSSDTLLRLELNGVKEKVDTVLKNSRRQWILLRKIAEKNKIPVD